MKSALIVLFAMFTLGASAHCPMDFTEANLCAEIEWTHGPVVNQNSHFKISFWQKGDKDRLYVTPGYEIKMYTWMNMKSGHNHPGPKITWTEMEPGVFSVMNAKFFMGGMKGHWQVRVELIDQAGDVSMASHDVRFKDHKDEGHHGGHGGH